MNSDAVERASADLNDRVGPMVTAANAGTAGTAAAGIAACMGFETAATLAALCGSQLDNAFRLIADGTAEHAHLLQATATAFRAGDDEFGAPFTKLSWRDGS